jgi:hypothetical protein
MLTHELSIVRVRARWQLPGSREDADTYEFSRLKAAATAAERRQSQTAQLMDEIEAQQHLENSKIRAILQSGDTAADIDISVKLSEMEGLFYRVVPEKDEPFPPLTEETVTTHMRDDAGRVIIRHRYCGRSGSSRI